jgi:hypothetical protein
VPLAVVGVLSAHAVANSLFGSPEGRDELFASAASGAQLVPLAAALATAVLALGLVLRIVRGASASVDSRVFAAPFACLPPLLFLLVETFEGLLSSGSVPVGEVLQAPFVAGLALQVPFAFAAYLLARALARASDGLRARLLRLQAVPWIRLRCAVEPRDDDRLRAAAVPSRARGRAPPVGIAVTS